MLHQDEIELLQSVFTLAKSLGLEASSRVSIDGSTVYTIRHVPTGIPVGHSRSGKHLASLLHGYQAGFNVAKLSTSSQ